MKNLILSRNPRFKEEYNHAERTNNWGQSGYFDNNLFSSQVCLPLLLLFSFAFYSLFEYSVSCVEQKGGNEEGTKPITNNYFVCWMDASGDDARYGAGVHADGYPSLVAPR